MRQLTLKDVEAAVKGGSVFASGGGGWVDHGMEIGTAAITIGNPKLVSIGELPDDAIIITSTAIGAPAGTTDWQMLGKDYIRAVELLQEKYNGEIVGVMTPQNGMSSSINGWLPAAVLGLVVVDATGDIRAHPTANMGAMGLNSAPDYETIEAVAGGKPETGSYIEMVVKGKPAKTSPILRTASDMSGGFIASARHPIAASYVKQHAAIGGVTMAIELGEAIIAAEFYGPEAILQAICKQTKGTVLGRGKVKDFSVKYTNEAFDIGTITVDILEDELKLHVMNEYMAVYNRIGERVACYPDVITTICTKTGRPISVGDIRDGVEVAVFSINKKYVPISSSVRDASVYPDVEKALGIKISDYALEVK